jgi:hypothetical protein
MIDQDPPHDACRHAKEVRAVLEGQLFVGGEPHKRFVHQGSRLQRVVFSLSAHLPGSDLSQFAVDPLEQCSRCRLVTLSDRCDEACHVPVGHGAF